MSKERGGSESGMGCLSTIVLLFVLWAMLFGVNYDGKHYGISCKNDGVTIEHGTP